MASTDAMRALLQRRLDASQVCGCDMWVWYVTLILSCPHELCVPPLQAESQELRQELKASDEMVNSLKVELAQLRISLSTQRHMGGTGSGSSTSRDELSVLGHQVCVHVCMPCVYMFVCMCVCAHYVYVYVCVCLYVITLLCIVHVCMWCSQFLSKNHSLK